MSVVLNDILTLVGRLDDAPGIDTPRDRFRRFLLELTDLDVARSLIEQGQRSLGEQHHRALQDAMIMLGRFLGFETTFGIYNPGAGAAKYDGLWRSRRRLEIVLDLRTNQTSNGDVDELSRSLSALAAIRHRDDDTRQLGLCVITPMYGGRARLEDALLTAKPQPSLRMASVRSLLWLADMVAAGRLSHDEIVRLLTSDISLDFAVDLLARFGAGHYDTGETQAPAEVAAALAPSRSDAYWVVVIGSDETATPEQFVESVICGRHILGVGDAGTAFDARAGDWLCFSLGVKGIVGHARVESIADGPGLLRASHRFRLVFRLKDIEIYDTPVMLARQASWDLIGASTPADDTGPFLAPVSREEFAELTIGALNDQPEGLHRAG